ncbi:transcriptional regulator, putative [Arcticibacter svalbardensis MN12-7]|uniref:Transcriptional regulator, putative n=1 Tax=Arcticibacter svalbardensis MN12-7 TaxID=1150600 RepID=R9GV71_9SPHI|nr:YafY family protein [Arcticibacter svalbardensis]EOR95425.1 transcriptional regulator, putative [Arcticibacter svalbardensis MN12-7]
MNRIDRLSAILIQLQSRKNTRAQDVANRYEISLRTVYRDIRSLEEAGVPIIGEAGRGYSLADGYRLPPLMFTREEATAFITAEKLVLSLTDQENSKSYSLAMDKIRAVLKRTDKDYLEDLDERIKVIKSKRHPEFKEHPNPLQIILQAIADKKVMQMTYYSYYRQQQSSRLVEPIGILYLDNYWHLIAYCRERKACRDFRFDRIIKIETTNECYQDVHISLENYLIDQYKAFSVVEITLLVDQEASLHLGEQKYYQGYVSEKQTAKGIEMKFLTLSPEGFSRWYMSIADCAIILQPDSIKKKVQLLFNTIKKNINFI